MFDKASLTIGDIARLHGIEVWKVRRLFERGILPEPPRAGVYRLIPKADLWRVESALRNAGYISKAEEAVPCA